MTATKDHSGKRKPSLDSKISVSSGSTRPVGRSDRSDTPSSILSSDSDIRFTRKLGDRYRCGCCIVAGFLLFLLVAGVAVYLAHTFIITNKPNEQIFRANFKVINGDTFSSILANPATEDFRIRSRSYRERLNLILRRSYLKPAFLKTDILALDGFDGEDLIVHFNLHFDPRRMKISTTDLEDVLIKEIIAEESPYLANITISKDSLSVKESNVDITTNVPSTTTSSTTTTTQRPPRQCTPLQLTYCLRLPYNITTYPNILGHNSLRQVVDDVIAFRELVDAECYKLAYEFVCQTLQPRCRPSSNTTQEDEMILPCRNFCKDFMKNCGGRVPERFKTLLDCSRFPELVQNNNCVQTPGCVDELRSRGMSNRLCDGIVDCTDFSDETDCSYCPKGYVHCGTGKHCVSPQQRCDGKKDCPNGSDEKYCLSVSPSLSAMEPVTRISHQNKYFSKGYVVFNEKGRTGKLCTENINVTVPEHRMESTLNNVASSLCNVLTYQKAESYNIVNDDESQSSSQYVVMEDPLDKEVSFIQAECNSKQVLQVSCKQLQCGIQSLRVTTGIQDLSKMSQHGDWPWHVALFKENVHICDATLMSDEWLLTTASCFQGQGKAEWTARLGSIRLTSSSPWEQERRIIGMVKSPVEGSTLVMIKMDEHVAFSDIVRPVCLPDKMIPQNNFTFCNTLGWSRTREQLQRVDLRINPMDKCENISIATVNSICTESSYLVDDCNEEEYAGSPLICLQSDKSKWSLIGVSNWRIACTQQGVERPRMYDKTSSNIEWIQKTMEGLTT